MNNRTPGIVAAIFIVLALLAAVAYKFFVDHRQDPTHQTQPPSIVLPAGPGISQQPAPAGISQQPAPDGSPARMTKGVIYTVSETGGGDDNNLVAQPVTWNNGQSPARESLEALIHSPNSPLPDGTALRGIKIMDGLATVDLGQEFQANFHGGDTAEAQTVNSILRTLGQFPSIDRVQILVEGKPIEALSQLPLDGPLDVIRPDPVRQARKMGGAASE